MEEHTNDDNQNLRYMKTAALLLNSPGIEVAARPWLYPSPAFIDTDISDRLKSINRIPQNSKPSIKTSWQRKLLSRCADYAKDFPLTALMHDVTLAKQLSSVVSMADKYKISPDEAAVGMQNFELFWKRETQKLEDMCRINGSLPNLFLTVAPAEWTFPLHQGIFGDPEHHSDLSSQQALLTLHLYHNISAVLEKLLFKDSTHLSQVDMDEVLDYA